MMKKEEGRKGEGEGEERKEGQLGAPGWLTQLSG